MSTKHKNRNSDELVFHYRAGLLPDRTTYEIDKYISVVSPELALLQVAPLVSLEELAALMSEFCGGYTVIDDSPHGMVQRPPLTTKRKLLQLANRMGNCRGIRPFTQAAALAFEGARSPMETTAALLLGLPRFRGGYGLGGFCLNAPIKLAPNAQKQFCVKELRPDILWPKERVCVEYDSQEFHADNVRVVNDANRKNTFNDQGYSVATLTRTQLYSAAATDVFAEQLQKALKHRGRPVNEARKQALRKALLGENSVTRRQYKLSERAGQAAPGQPWHMGEGL